MSNWQRRGETEVLGEKRVQVLPNPPQIPHGMPWDRTRPFAVTGWRLIP